MSNKLTEEIINHIFSNLFIINNSQFDNNKFKSLKSDDFILNKNISFEDENGQEIKKNIWGVQIMIEKQPFKMLLADCSIEPNIAEYCLIVSLSDAPTYGVYSCYSFKDPLDSQALIAISVDKQNYMQCNMYLQATFLAGMENLKDIPYTMEKVSDYDQEYNLLLSFLNYHNFIFGDNNEGQENKL